MKIYGFCLLVLVLTKLLVGQEVQPLTILVYDSAQVPARYLSEAEAEVQRILDHAGVHTKWMPCTVTTSSLPQLDDCTESFKVLHVRMNILAKPKAGFRLTDSMFGYAMTDPEGIGPACYVFYDRIRDLPESWEIRRSAVLGLVAAHELGHLLLGSNSHNLTGIMSANLDANGIKAGRLGRLGFNAEQAIKIRERIIRAAQSLRSWPKIATMAHENAVAEKPDVPSLSRRLIAK